MVLSLTTSSLRVPYSIEPVLSQKSSSCFLSTTAVCGNGLVEEGEQCDCGDIMSCQDPCCQASGTGEGECMFVLIANCSQEASTGGVCCTDLCEFVPAVEMRVCQPETVCTAVSTNLSTTFLHYYNLNVHLGICL